MAKIPTDVKKLFAYIRHELIIGRVIKESDYNNLVSKF